MRASVVEDVRVQTMEILLWLETVRTSTQPARRRSAIPVGDVTQRCGTFTPCQANARC